jgi:hypothetical protein
MTLAACNGKSTAGTTGNTGNTGNTGITAAACDSHAGKVRQLYAAEARSKAPAAEGDEARALREQEVEDNTHMILEDCRRQPAALVPCLERASSVAELERDCVIPLDDKGTVEGDYFAPSK